MTGQAPEGLEARLARLKGRFLDRCREDLQVVRAPPDAEALRAVLHRLAGAGGTFGYPGITRLAARAEDELLQGRAPDLAELIAALAALPGEPPA